MDGSKSKPKILFYDIETSPLAAWVWRPGKQVVRHGQLIKGHTRYGIICITYCFNDGKAAKCIDWGFEEQDTAKVVSEFDTIVRETNPDIIIGKNSDRFDNKHLNSVRMYEGLDAFPEFMDRTDDLEKQMRKYFYLPSYTLDYFSAELGLGGKIKMEFQDWIDIVTRDPVVGPKALKKMCTYGKKDIVDTRALWEHCNAHFKPKFNAATKLGIRACTNCGSESINKNGTRVSGKTTYQHYYCKNHGGYAGKSPVSLKGKIGKIGA